jgi:hypothetical protein
MAMKDLRPANTGQGPTTASRAPASAHLNSDGALVLNASADQLIGGDRWRVRYEDSASATPAIELVAASSSDAGAFTVTRSNVSSARRGSTSKITLRALRAAVGDERWPQWVGRYAVRKMAGGLCLRRVDEAVVDEGEEAE